MGMEVPIPQNGWSLHHTASLLTAADGVHFTFVGRAMVIASVIPVQAGIQTWEVLS